MPQPHDHHYLIYAAIGLLGVAFQTVLKLQSVKAKAKANNLKFAVKDYFTDDYLSIISSVLAVGLCLTFIPELEAHYPAVGGWFRVTFGFIGYTGASVISRFFSVVDKNLTNATAFKANIADEATGNKDAPTPMKAVKQVTPPSGDNNMPNP